MATTKLFIGLGDLSGCGYYRCLIPYGYLSELGFDVHIVNKLNIELTPNDVLILQRQHSEGVIERVKNFKSTGGKIVYELDDYLHELPPNNPCKKSYPKGGKELANVEELMKLSDLLIVSTPSLGNNYSKFAKNIKVCYNSIDSNEIKINSNDIDNILNQNKDMINIGWAGSATHLDDLLQIIKPITEILKEYPQTKFTFVGENYTNLFPREVRNKISYAGRTFISQNKPIGTFWKNNSVINYYELLKSAKIDIAIAPLIHMTFNRSKSAIKLLEYGICGIPFVASRFGPYAQYINESKNKVGFLAEKTSEWKKSLKLLIENKSLRIELAKNNLINIQTNYTIDTGKKQWLTALESIGAYPDGSKGSYVENIQLR